MYELYLWNFLRIDISSSYSRNFTLIVFYVVPIESKLEKRKTIIIVAIILIVHILTSIVVVININIIINNNNNNNNNATNASL